MSFAMDESKAVHDKQQLSPYNHLTVINPQKHTHRKSTHNQTLPNDHMVSSVR